MREITVTVRCDSCGDEIAQDADYFTLALPVTRAKSWSSFLVGELHGCSRACAHRVALRIAAEIAEGKR